jgi:DnaJ family protein C protein 9
MVVETLYTILNVSKGDNIDEIRKAYYKQALKVHPDRLNTDATEKEKIEAKEKFQHLSLAYGILSDGEKRKIYDLTGVISEEDLDLQKDADWETYWRELFPKVTKQDIEEFEKQYKGNDLFSSIK